jgi:RNA polymerase sigma-70 factor (ECF subfamily)
MTRDEQLARDLASGSAAAWHALYDAFAEAVWRCVARRVGPHAADVADIVQETFLAAARSARKYDAARGSPWAWLSGIARRQAALHFRRKQTRHEATGGDGPQARSASEGAPLGSVESADGRFPDPADLVITAETAMAVRQALATLPLDYETLLVGKYMDGLSLDDLAETENATLAATSSKLARARRAFREAFEKLVTPTTTRSVSEGTSPTRSVSEGLPTQARSASEGARSQPT